MSEHPQAIAVEAPERDRRIDRNFFLDLAAAGLRMPIGADLVLHEEPEPDKVRNNGPALGRAIEKAARRWHTPLAIPLMDLRLEKNDLLALAGVVAADAEPYHFTAPLDESMLQSLCGEQTVAACPGSQARDQALAYIAAQPDLVAVGMAIGPFSLMTRLLADPITLIALAGTGIQPDESEEALLLVQCMRIAEAAVLRSVRSQISHGAQAIVLCEPAACTAFISPRQLKAGSNLFDRLVMEPNLRVKAELDRTGCNLIFHDCGVLIDSMVEAFAHRLRPEILSLGSSRTLWDDARLVPKDVVLYGNLPSKSFYSDSTMPVAEVVRRAGELITRMRACGHPHILGTECDVLFVPEACEAIRAKVDAMMTCASAD